MELLFFKIYFFPPIITSYDINCISRYLNLNQEFNLLEWRELTIIKFTVEIKFPKLSSPFLSIHFFYQEFNFDSTKFKLKYVLGSGSFGVVTFAEYTDVNTKKITYYALKSLSKATVIETGTQMEYLFICLMTLLTQSDSTRLFVIL